MVRTLENLDGRVTFKGQFFHGSVLGDYSGGGFQTFNPVRAVPVRASGGWTQLTYDINDRWQVNGGFGRDDPYNRDLSLGRSLNQKGYTNAFYKITPRLWTALEFSHWRTLWIDVPEGNAFRIEQAFMFFF